MMSKVSDHTDDGSYNQSNHNYIGLHNSTSLSFGTSFTK